MARGSRKRPLDFGGNPDYVTLGLRVSIKLRLWLGFELSRIPAALGIFYRCSFSSNSLAVSAAPGGGIRSAIFIYIYYIICGFLQIRKNWMEKVGEFYRSGN